MQGLHIMRAQFSRDCVILEYKRTPLLLNTDFEVGAAPVYGFLKAKPLNSSTSRYISLLSAMSRGQTTSQSCFSSFRKNLIGKRRLPMRDIPIQSVSRFFNISSESVAGAGMTRTI